MNALKFTGIAAVGDTIKAYDFMPMPDRPDSWLEGVVLDADCTEQGFKAFKMQITRRVFAGKDEAVEPDELAWVPHQVSFMEYDNRITVLNRA